MKSSFRLAMAAVLAAAATLAMVPMSASAEGSDSVAQATVGKDFWMSWNINYATWYTDGAQNLIYIAPTEDGSATVSWPDGTTSDFDLTENVVTTVDVRSHIYPDYFNSSGVHHTAVHIASTATTAVYGLNLQDATSDAWMALPTPGLGSDYWPLAGQAGRCCGPNFMSIMATADGTTVVTVTDNQGVDTVQSLSQGDVFTVSKGVMESSSESIDGYHISSDNPVGVLTGNNCYNAGHGACDHVVEQLMPTTALGKDYIFAPTGNQQTDHYSVLATADSTTVTINGDDHELNAGERYNWDASGNGGAQVISATAPIVAAQFMDGGLYGPDHEEGDPSLIYGMPTLQYMKHYTVALPSAVMFPYQWVSIVAKTADLGSLLIDGTDVDTSAFTAVAGTDYSFGRVDTAEGSHTISSTSGFSLSVYGTGWANSYAYTGGSGLVNLIDNPGGVDQVDNGGASVPGTPTGASAAAGNGQATVSWTAPASDGGAAIDYYTVTASPTGATCTAIAPETTCTVLALVNGMKYTFTVKAHNSVGNSAGSAASAAIWPHTDDFQVRAENNTIAMGGSTTVHVWGAAASKPINLVVGGQRFALTSDANGDVSQLVQFDATPGNRVLVGKSIKVAASSRKNGSVVSASDTIFVAKLTMRAKFREGHPIQAIGRSIAPGAHVVFTIARKSDGNKSTLCEMDIFTSYATCQGTAPAAGDYTLTMTADGASMATNNFTVTPPPAKH